MDEQRPRAEARGYFGFGKSFSKFLQNPVSTIVYIRLVVPGPIRLRYSPLLDQAGGTFLPSRWL